MQILTQLGHVPGGWPEPRRIGMISDRKIKQVIWANLEAAAGVIELSAGNRVIEKRFVDGALRYWHRR